MRNKAKILIQVKGLGFTFILDQKNETQFD